MQPRVEFAFAKYSQNGLLEKHQFKCAFIYLTGFKPTRDDLQLAKLKSEGMSLRDFSNLMTVYLQQMDTSQTTE